MPSCRGYYSPFSLCVHRVYGSLRYFHDTFLFGGSFITIINIFSFYSPLISFPSFFLFKDSFIITISIFSLYSPLNSLPSSFLFGGSFITIISIFSFYSPPISFPSFFLLVSLPLQFSIFLFSLISFLLQPFSVSCTNGT